MGYPGVPYDQIVLHEERFERTFPDGSFVFVNSMGEPYYWSGSQVKRVQDVISKNPQAMFLLLTHNERTFDFWRVFENARFGLSITSDAEFRRFAVGNAAYVFDFLSFEPFKLSCSNKFDPLLEMRNEVSRVIMGGQSGLRPREEREYYRNNAFDFQSLVEILEDLGWKTFVKENGKRFGVEPTLLTTSKASEKKPVLDQYWKN